MSHFYVTMQRQHVPLLCDHAKTACPTSMSPCKNSMSDFYVTMQRQYVPLLFSLYSTVKHGDTHPSIPPPAHHHHLLTYLCPSLPVEHRPSTTPRHHTLFWAALVIPHQLVPCRKSLRWRPCLAQVSILVC